MKVTLEWLKFMKYADADFFVVSANLYEFEKKVLKKTGIHMQGAAHTTRRFEYPWAYFQASAGEQCLDAGGGLNPLSFALAEIYKQVTVIDIDSEAINSLNEITKAFQFNMIAKQGDLRKLDYPDKYFDDVFCISVIEHGPINPDIVDAIKELLRVTKRKLILTMDVGKKGTPSGPLCIKNVSELFNYLKIKPHIDEEIDCLKTLDIEPYTILCMCIEKNLNTDGGM
jgi:ubiquinone/menaquinone biosynthesis C-methylase UbiE